MTLTDEEIGLIFETHNGNIVDSIRAVIAAHDERLRQQEPYCFIYEYDTPLGLHRSFQCGTYNGKEPNRAVKLYAAPIPPEQPEYDALQANLAVMEVERDILSVGVQALQAKLTEAERLNKVALEALRRLMLCDLAEVRAIEGSPGAIDNAEKVLLEAAK